jgi:hypothetical protein
MVFDVLAPGEDWIVLGSKKGWFVASVSGDLERIGIQSGREGVWREVGS